MIRPLAIWTFVPALLLTTAVGGALAQDPGQVVFTLDGSGGVAGFNLPSYDTGMGHVADGNLFGGMIGGKLSAKLGDAGGWGVVLGIDAFGSFGAGSIGWSDTRTGTGTISGLDAGAGTIALSTADPATSTVTGPGGGVASTSAALASVNNVAAVTPDSTGFELSAVTTDGSAGAAYGGIGSTTGGRFQYDGTVVVNTSVTRSVFYGGADLTIGMNGNFDSSTGVEVYAGPSFRGLVQGVSTAFRMDIPETQPSTITIPTFTIAINDHLTSTYLGGVFGGNVSFEGSPGVVFTLGAEGGVYAVHSSWEAHDTYSTCCGVAGTSSPSLSVDGPSHTADLGNTMAYSARGTGSASFALDANKTVTVGGNVGYLSNVPTISRPGGVLTFGTSSMITYGATVSLAGHF